MSNDPTKIEVDDDEWLARFVFSRGHIRASDNTVKADAFIPPQNLELSVARHLNLSSDEIWGAGMEISKSRPAVTLCGRADIQATSARRQFLNVRSQPPPKYHAVIYGWPSYKPAQKIIALELARLAHYSPKPD